MAKLKGIKRIDKIINNYLAKFGLTAELGEEFAYWTDDFKIDYTLVMPENVVQYMLPFAHHINPNVNADVFLVAFYHELGHHYTQYNFSQEDWEISEEIKEHIEKNVDKNPKKEAKWNNIYFNLDVERAATEWGLNYMEKYSEEVAEFWNELQPAIMRFYRKNEIEI